MLGYAGQPAAIAEDSRGDSKDQRRTRSCSSTTSTRCGCSSRAGRRTTRRSSPKYSGARRSGAAARSSSTSSVSSSTRSPTSTRRTPRSSCSTRRHRTSRRSRQPSSPTFRRARRQRPPQAAAAEVADAAGRPAPPRRTDRGARAQPAGDVRGNGLSAAAGARRRRRPEGVRSQLRVVPQVRLGRHRPRRREPEPLGVVAALVEGGAARSGLLPEPQARAGTRDDGRSKRPTARRSTGWC